MITSTRPWLIVVILGLVIISPAYAVMSPEEIRAFEDQKAKALQGNPDAQCNVAYYYEKGQGIAKDLVQAAIWYRKAAEQGHPISQYNLGCLYDKGDGVKQDNEEAFFWYRKATEQGYAQAQSSLGVFYIVGKGVKSSGEKAVYWWRKAAEQGHAQAQFELANCYAIGENVAKDEVEAYAYYNLAGITYAEAVKRLTILEKKLSRNEVAAGQKRSKELQKEIELKIESKKAGK